MKKKLNKVNLSLWVNKFILKEGKLLSVDNLLFLLVKELKKNPFFIINEAINNVSPSFIIKEVRIGKKKDKVLYIPLFIVSKYTRKRIGLGWLINFALKKKGSFVKNLVVEIFDAFYNKGPVKQKLDLLNLQVLEHRSNLKFKWK